MIYIEEDKSISVTRGDIAIFSVSADVDGERHTFKPGDVVRFKVFEKKNAENVVLQKDFGIEEECENVTISLAAADTKIGGVISKPVDYWYEVELNPFDDPQTIIGYDDDGAKIFKLLPEGRDLEIVEPEEEDIPVVDAELDMTSTRPVQNQAIARRITYFAGTVDALLEENERLRNDVQKVEYDLALQKKSDFEITKSSPRMRLANTEISRSGEVHFSNSGNLILSSKLDDDNLVGIWVKPETSETQDYLDLGTYIGGEFTRYPIFGTYNKPTGKYEGTGSATTRIVTTGGIGSTLKISTSKGMAIVTGAGAICKKYSSTEVYGLTAEQCNFDKGVLTLTTNDDVVNGARDYYYEVL